ncbi:type II secretion system protein GspL [Ferrovum sp. PN-J185]|uniref:type II secretion system protein GspL n=1 Tax=Ferrovum sp. PN-J185 TaxID=1356306 RepID=UPI001E41263D|nr:type II secretion system protein GspL [Ferrovum sp. PN-J185]MCC6068153.1 type II secretion system protein GspL [Ferrovum sp. PN-J185]MDE1891734.1 hypothetical protein [Betaproteobacteria bacterium]MDE2056424.1 hypothetical protein [Betaproteobacteria bacterium]
MTILWIELPERPRGEEEDIFNQPLNFSLTHNHSPYHTLQKGTAYIDELPVSQETVLITHPRDVLIIEKTVEALKSLSGQRLLQTLPSLLEDEVMYFDKNHVAIWRDTYNPAHMAFALIDRVWLRHILSTFNEFVQRGPLKIIPASYFQEVGSLVQISESRTVQQFSWACYRELVHQTLLVPLNDPAYLKQNNIEHTQILNTSLLGRLHLLTDTYIDLRQFEFVDKHLGWRAQWIRWRSVIVLFFISLIIETVGVNLYWVSLLYQEHQLLNEERNIAQKVIPQLPKDIDPYLALRHEWQVANQSASTNDKDFVVLCAKLSHIMVHQPADAVSKINYHHGLLEVTLKPGINIDMVKQDAQSNHVILNNVGGGTWQIK